MSFFDSIEKLAEGVSSGGTHATVAGGLLQELEGSGGVTGIVQQMQQNGAGGLLQQWMGGQTQGANATQIEQALGGSGLIDNIAQRTGVSADTVRTSLAVIVPLLVSHLASNGHVTPNGQPTGNPVPDSGSLIQSILGKLL